MADKSVRVVADAGDKRWETVNIVTSPPANNQAEKCIQVTALQAAAANNEIPTVQDSGGSVAGLRTVYISGYTAPN